ncbi:MAG: hypothetical protein KTR32_26325 [Granulosicoccus sp.]|nr:hypothetical protein [Granulosicoccus sp.]
MSEHFKTVLAKAVVTVLRPLLRVLIKNEISHAEFSELARQAYVQVAYENFSIPGRKTTYSRVAVLTGLSRKEVVRLQKLLEEDNLAIKSSPNRAVRVINGWLKDAEFLDASNDPMDLPLHGEQGSFATLVARYSGDITLGAVVDELERVGVVSRPDKQTVRLNSIGYIPQEDELEKIKILSICTADLLETAVHNLDAQESDVRFQRQMIYPNVPNEIVQEFKRYSSDKSSSLLQDLNRFLADRTKPDDASGISGSRVGLGVYFFENKHKQEQKK